MKNSILIVLIGFFSLTAFAEFLECQEYLYPAEVGRCQMAEYDKLELQIYESVQTIADAPQVFGKKTSSEIVDSYESEKKKITEYCKSDLRCQYEHLERIDRRFKVLIKSRSGRVPKAIHKQDEVSDGS